MEQKINVGRALPWEQKQPSFIQEMMRALADFAIGGGLLPHQILVGPKSKGWEKREGKFTDLATRSEWAPVSDEGLRLRTSLKEALDKASGKVTFPAKDAIVYPAVEEAYPELMDRLRVGTEYDPSSYGSWSRRSKTIFLSPGNKEEETLGTLAHEVEHAITEYETGLRGANTSGRNVMYNAEELVS